MLYQVKQEKLEEDSKKAQASGHELMTVDNIDRIRLEWEANKKKPGKQGKKGLAGGQGKNEKSPEIFTLYVMQGKMK